MRLAIVLLVAGCRSIFGIHDPDVTIDAANQDAAGDGMVIDANNCRSFSTVIDTCALPAGMPMPGRATNYDSDTGALVVGGSEVAVSHVIVSTIGGPLDVVSITTFVQDADAMLRITGTRPVAFAVSGQIEIAGRIDLSAGGAGAGCDATSTGEPGVVTGSAGDGGGGGGNATIGGDGGGGGAHSTSTRGGAAAMPGYHVGCSGGRGGSQAAGGLGGGGFYLVAASDILLSGTIDVSGGGGKGAIAALLASGGGGGGGAGGALVIEAPRIAVTGQLDATGGGGGGGGSQTVSGVVGKLGSTGGNGGRGSTNNMGGHGGTGSLAAGAGAAGTTLEGGGGGGGAVGRIGIVSADFTNGGMVAPPPS